MPASPLCLVFDIGKTNKKWLLLSPDYSVVEEGSVRIRDGKDDDGFPCEDLPALEAWMKESLSGVMDRHNVRAVNISAYGASLVHLGQTGQRLLPLYNYLRPYPEELHTRFDSEYGTRVHTETASPRLGSLNSGLQLYRIKYEQPDRFNSIRYSLHFPNYLSYLLTGTPVTEITSVGCHTLLWDYRTMDYHAWVKAEGLDRLFAQMQPAGHVVQVRFGGKSLLAGTGLHDSSSALIPYLATVREPFVLLSTGTWNIALNPFNSSPLTDMELANDCLNYLSFESRPVKSSRLHAGPMHEHAQSLSALSYDKALDQIIEKQAEALSWMDSPSSALFVEGGFSQNPLFMKKLALRFPGRKVLAAELGQASALGAALTIHAAWNPLRPGSLISFR